MNQDEANRIAEQLRKSVPAVVAGVLAVEFNYMNQKWEVKCDEYKSPQGGRGIIVWVKSPAHFAYFKKRWLELASKEQQS